jgi:hypothetical protein
MIKIQRFFLWMVKPLRFKWGNQPVVEEKIRPGDYVQIRRGPLGQTYTSPAKPNKVRLLVGVAIEDSEKDSMDALNYITHGTVRVISTPNIFKVGKR